MSWRNAVCVLCAAVLCSGAVMASDPTGAYQAITNASTGAQGAFGQTSPATKEGFTGNVAPATDFVPEEGVSRIPGDTCADPFTITLGQTVNGTTVGFANDYDYACPYTGSLSTDVVYRLTLTAAASVDIVLCQTTAYDTKVYVYTGTCTNPPAACNDDTCGSDGYKSALYGVALGAGTHYIIVDGYGGESGAYVMTVSEAIPCVVTCPTGGIPENEPDCGPNYVDTWNGGCNSTPSVFKPVQCATTLCGKSGTYLYGTSNYRDTDWYTINPDPVPANTRLTATGQAEFAFLMFFLQPSGAIDCPVSTLVSGTAAMCTDLTITFDVLAAGRKFLWAGPSVFTGVPCGSDYRVALTCVPITGCEVNCVTGDILENEPICTDEYEDTFNSGCNFEGIGAPPFSPYTCANPWGPWVCGQGGTYLFVGGNYRDTDWFSFTITGPATLNLEGTAEFSFLQFLIQAGPQPDICVGYSILTSGTAAACANLTLTAAAPAAGEYWWWAGTSVFAGVPCGSIYRSRTGCVPSGGCVVTCPTGGIPENEPPCGPNYVDTWNGGCNSTPPVFKPVQCATTLCGKAGTYLYGTSNYRDTDWFTINPDPVPASTRLTAVGQAEFPFLMFFLRPSGATDCPVTTIVSGTAAQCVDLTITTDTTAAGRHFLWCGPSVFSGIPCDADYRVALTCLPIGPCTVTCPPGSQLENEPDCGPNYTDTWNGGCNSTPPVFKPINCGQTMCGKYGTFLYGASNYRDTDWFTYTTTSAGTITHAMNGEAASLAFILTITPPCTAVVVASGTGAACTPFTVTAAAQPAGNYVAWAGTSVFTGVPCGADYTYLVTANCAAPCPRGDTNCDGAINTFDIDCFVAAVTGGQAAWQACAPSCPPTQFLCRNDINCDGAVNTFDIDMFVQCVVTGTCPPCP